MEAVGAQAYGTEARQVTFLRAVAQTVERGPPGLLPAQVVTPQRTFCSPGRTTALLVSPVSALRSRRKLVSSPVCIAWRSAHPGPAQDVVAVGARDGLHRPAPEGNREDAAFEDGEDRRLSPTTVSRRRRP